MPFSRLIQETDDERDSLRERLRQEWAEEATDPDGPIIIETVDKIRPQQVPTHLYVIWDAWRELSQRQRSEIMMDVYEQVRGRAKTLNVTVAMGLTPEEAKRMGLHYATPSAA